MPGLIYRLDNVVKAYGSREVCRIQVLDVRRSEILGILGPNGAGKTTLLRMLNFLEQPTSGDLLFEDKRVNGRVPLEWRRRVTTVFQEPVLLSGSVRYNVAYGLRLRGEREAGPKVEQALLLVEMAHLTHAHAHTLSGGEARRVALARALVLDPEVLLLDEPTAHLDPYNGSLIEEAVRTVNREKGTTVVLVTHNRFQAERLAHRVAVMLQGRVLEVGPTLETLVRPKDPRSAAFFKGEMAY